jgi:hypothetical protein
MLCLACSDSSTDPESIAGVYVWESVDGRRVPFTVSAGGGDTETVSGALTLRADLTFTITQSWRFRPSASSPWTPTNVMGSGTYSRNGSALTFVGEGEVIEATLSGDTITFRVEGAVLLFRRQ